MAQELCCIGSIVAAHGVKGAVRLRSFSDIPGRFARLESVLVGSDPATARSMRVTGGGEDDARVILQFEGCEDRDCAEELAGLNVYITDEQMEAPPEGRHFIHDLIGCAVRTPENEDRGVVRDVMLLPANDVYVVNHRGFEVLVPAVPAFIRKVDTENKLIVVEPVPGLFEDFDED